MNTLALIIDWSNIISFAVGIVAGVLLVFSVFALIIARGKKESKKPLSPEMSKLSDETIKLMIEKKQKDFITEIDENDADFIKTVSSMTLDLLHEISSYYYPDSTYPEYELTIDEAAELIKYIVDSIMKWLDKPVFRGVGLKNKKISSIYSYIDKYNRTRGNKLVKASTSKDAKTAWDIGRAVANVINPVYWFKKTVVNGSLHLALKRLCKVELHIAGEEFNKVYSKKLFVQDAEIKDEKQIEADIIEEVFSDEGSN